MRRVLSATLLALAALLSSAAVQALQAQDIPSPYRYVETTQSAAAFAGYLWTDRGDPQIGPHSAPLLGASYRVRLTGPLSGQVLVGVMPTSRTLFQAPVPGDSAFPIRPVGEASALLVAAQAGMVFTLTGPRTWNGLAPYAAADVGLVADVTGGGDADEAIPQDQRFDFGPGLAVGVSLGTDWYLSERLSLRLEARDQLWRIETPQGLIFGLGSETEWTHNLGITIGTALHF